jgi:hypothetical protein
VQDASYKIKILASLLQYPNIEVSKKEFIEWCEDSNDVKLQLEQIVKYLEFVDARVRDHLRERTPGVSLKLIV